MLENVASMSQTAKDEITKQLGVEPIMIDAALVSAQSRKRLFWTNIPAVGLPEDKGIKVKDILEPAVNPKYHIKKAITLEKEPETTNSLHKVGNLDGKTSQWCRVYDPKGKSATLNANGGGVGAKTGLYVIRVGSVQHMDNIQGYRIYSPDGKSTTLSSTGGGAGANTGLYAMGRSIGRRTDAEGKRKDGDSTIEYVPQLEIRGDDKTGTLTSVQKDNLVISPPIVRRLTPLECERLQSLPDNYTEGISDTQRYKTLGNAFNAEVVAHILKKIPSGV